MSLRKYKRSIARAQMKKQGYHGANKKVRLTKAEKGHSFFAGNWRTFSKEAKTNGR